ncbi:hypothetical protein SEA_MUFASA8_50 [Arthrobacter phage Mufasa8]|uniref:Uncharacterized protein n=1 Tax=Arthrobacter phage Mufasa8 TaxID=2656526 RepID=A0A649VNN4_9CAUD|nr:hypothetical protein HYQ08_gp050 [Arthrobacter phage Mufasa8]QGJ93552.1 hypothetical protein SEA_MUFASA8_50 [Arthrobacter phage Mufasa8]
MDRAATGLLRRVPGTLPGTLRGTLPERVQNGSGEGRKDLICGASAPPPARELTRSAGTRGQEPRNLGDSAGVKGSGKGSENPSGKGSGKGSEKGSGNPSLTP